MFALKVVAAISLVLLFSVAVMSWVHNGDRDYIEEWMTHRNEAVLSSELRTFRTGPYHFNGKSHRVYRVVTQSDRVFWFRMGNLFAPDVEEEKEGKYIPFQ